MTFALDELSEDPVGALRSVEADSLRLILRAPPAEDPPATDEDPPIELGELLAQVPTHVRVRVNGSLFLRGPNAEDIWVPRLTVEGDATALDVRLDGAQIPLLGETRMIESYAFAIAALLTLTVGMLLTRSASQRRPWVFGWRTTVDGGGWWLLPFAMIGAIPAAIWASTSIGTRPTEFAAALGAGAFAIAAGEVWFRGLVHGMLVPDFSVQRPRGAWMLSRAAVVSSAAYAVVATLMATPAFKHPLLDQSGASQIEIALGAGTLFFAVGLALAALRERSLSFLPGLMVQVVGLGIAATVSSLLF